MCRNVECADRLMTIKIHCYQYKVANAYMRLSQVFQFSPTFSQLLTIMNAVNKLQEDFVLTIIFKENYSSIEFQVLFSQI